MYLSEWVQVGLDSKELWLSVEEQTFQIQEGKDEGIRDSKGLENSDEDFMSQFGKTLWLTYQLTVRVLKVFMLWLMYHFSHAFTISTSIPFLQFQNMGYHIEPSSQDKKTLSFTRFFASHVSKNADFSKSQPAV